MVLNLVKKDSLLIESDPLKLAEFFKIWALKYRPLFYESNKNRGPTETD